MFEIGKPIKRNFNRMSIHNGEKGEVIIFYLEITTELKTIPKKQMATEVNRL